MTLQALGFRRLVLGLQPDAADRSAELACELASLFDLELLGLFLDNISLRRLVAMPAARAISALGAGWSPAAALSPSFLEDAAGSAERRFVEASANSSGGGSRSSAEAGRKRSPSSRQPPTSL